jgi:electron transfer flavoprotein alpha subunit
MRPILVIGGREGAGLQASALETLAAAASLAGTTGQCVVGATLGARSDGLPGTGEQLLAAVHRLVERIDPSLVLAPHGGESAEWAPQLAGALGAAVLLGCHSITYEEQTLVARKLICGGAIEAEYELGSGLAIVTLEAGAYAAAAPACEFESAPLPPTPGRVVFLDSIEDPSGFGPPLAGARVIVSGGLGLGGREHWQLVTDTAAALGAAVGATRAAVESGWAPACCQVGYSGSKVAPELYIALGISGAVHHLAGIAHARNVVAVNTDANAEIFRVARFGVVGDARQVMPAFLERLRALRDAAASGAGA